MTQAPTSATISFQPRSSRRLLWIAGALTAALWCAALALLFATDHRLEQWLDGFTDHSVTAQTVATVLSQLVQVHTLTLVIALVSLLDRRVRWALLRDAAWIMGTQAAASEVLKHVFGRLRPNVAEATIFCGPTLTHGQYSFPSGHATASFALAGALSSYYPRWRWAFIAAAAAVAVSRVMLDRHFFSDTLAGAALGWYLAVLMLAWLRRDRKRVVTSEESVPEQETEEPLRARASGG